MVLPPPNVTGRLHVGHALTVAIQDAHVRWARTQGRPSVYVPGTDHAGIATQVVVERALAPVTRQQLGRSAFEARVWQWRDTHGALITQQLRRLGAALDWERELFTLDPRACVAVREAFCRLAEAGSVYRAARLVHWCPQLQTVISDMETDHRLVPDALMHLVSYGPGVSVATTRPDTIPADVAVAVHSQDARYAHLTHVTHPLTGARLPVVRDDVLVDPAMGTGVVKVTPLHSVADYECALRHDLPLEPRVTGALPSVAAVLDALKARGTYEGARPHAMRVPICSRTGAVLEPQMRPQWFVRTAAMAQRAAGWEHIIPERHRGDWRQWLENPRDWCISRQLWWGHRIPAYTRDGGVTWSVLRDEPPAHEAWTQDEDVLDTWFSSALFPLVAHGWPGPVDRTCYPLSLMETGSDILFFWVARMVMMCSELVPEAGPPFERVLLHPMVRDAQGRKMSKSVGNVVDPLQLIDAHGADALRFALLDATEATEAVLVDEAQVVLARSLCNKLTNAHTFVARFPAVGPLDASEAPEQWLQHQCALLSATCESAYASGRVHRAPQAVRHFVAQFCDVYIEWAKHRDAARVGPWLHAALTHLLRHLHPVMPYLTSRLLLPEQLSTPPPAVLVGAAPHSDEPMLGLIGLVSALRSTGARPERAHICPAPEWDAVVAAHLAQLRALTRVPALTVHPDALELVLPVRGTLSVSVPQAAGTERSVAKAAERARAKLARLEERWAAADPARTPPEALRNAQRVREQLRAEIAKLAH